MTSAAQRSALRRHVAGVYARVYAVVARIPRGRVMTYGQVAEVAGLPRGARVAGYAMRASARRVPWQRVLGRRSPGVAHVAILDPVGGALQRQLLEDEGVVFSKSGGVSLERFGWMGAARASRARRGKRSGRRG